MRKNYLDNIRWLVVALVAIYHVFYMYNGENIPGGLGKITDLKVQYYDLYLYIVYPWLMPILFIVSGISARLLLQNCSDREFLRNRSIRLLIPSTLGLFVFQFIQGYINMSLSDALQAMMAVPFLIRYLIMAVSGIGVLWYIQLLWVFSFILILIRKIEKDRLWNLGKKTGPLTLVMLAGVTWLSAQILNTPVIVVYRFGLYGFMFLTGYYIFSHEEVIELLKKHSAMLGMAAVLSGIVFCGFYFGENFADAPVNRTLAFTSYCWFGCLTILGTMKRYGDRENDFTRWMRKHSFGLYLFHYLGISAVALLIAKSGLLPAWSIYLLSLLAGFVLSYLLYALFTRIPFLGFAVMGIDKERRNKNV